jgi:pimeloyl-ACP methyl ester carboxylesterase
VVVIVMENKEFGQVIGSRSAPYTNALARRYALATRYYAVRHPSLPNYLALTSGSTLGVHSDCTNCQQSASSVADQLDAAGLSWKAYMGGMPSACFKGATSGRYAKKHDPFMYYRGVANDPARCAKVVPGGRLATDAKAGRLPAFSFVSPDLCDDSHDCPIGTGDRYLARTVPALLNALGPHGFLVLTYDEGSSNAGCCTVAHGGRIATVIAGPNVKPGAHMTTPVSHYSTLRTIEEALGLAPLRNAARAAPLDAAFTSPPRLR